MLSKLMLRTLLATKFKHLKSEDREKIIALFEKDPQFFMAVAKDIKEEMASGKSEEESMRAVVNKHRDTLGNLLH